MLVYLGIDDRMEQFMLIAGVSLGTHYKILVATMSSTWGGCCAVNM